MTILNNKIICFLFFIILFTMLIFSTIYASNTDIINDNNISDEGTDNFFDGILNYNQDLNNDTFDEYGGRVGGDEF